MESQKLQFTRISNCEIFLGNDIIKETVAKIYRLRTAKRCTVITNDVVAKWYLQPLLADMRTRGITTHEIIIPDGEKHKTPETALSVISQLYDQEMDRDCPIIALVGGVICDLAGFVASIFKRGLPLILMPTSLMAMVDASIGGKTAVNLDKGKNLLGTFYQPILTAIDVSMLRTLPLTQLSYGLVEAIKHGAIEDAAYFRFILKNSEAIKAKQTNLLQRLIRRSIHIKKSVVIKDELDKGQRLKLNFGHTFGHALESAGNFIRLHHGEAVGLGMLLAIKSSAALGVLKEDYSEALQNLLTEFNLPVKIPNELDKSVILDTILQDKKKNQDGYNFILPVTLGKVIDHRVPAAKSHSFLQNILDTF